MPQIGLYPVASSVSDSDAVLVLQGDGRVRKATRIQIGAAASAVAAAASAAATAAQASIAASVTIAAVTLAGTTQGTATTLANRRSIITSGSAGQGALLVFLQVGADRIVTNKLAISGLVYPPTGARIDTEATNAAVQIAAGQTVAFVPETTTQWWSVS